MSSAEFSAQGPVVQLLQRSLNRGRLSHAYLFVGAALEELEKMAGTLAKTVNCKNPPARAPNGLALDSCDRCPSCRKIDQANHADVNWIRPESKSRIITIDQMRDLMQTIYLKPTEAEYKVAIIVAADRLNVQAANAFLKTLEEPPDKSLIVLITTEAQRLLETIVSRCLRLSFSGDEAARITLEQNQWIAEFSKLAALKNKGLLDRYGLLSVLMSELARTKEETEKALTARSPLERHDDVDPKLREKWEDELAAAIEAEYRRQRADALVGLQWWLRDIWLRTLKISGSFTFPGLAEHVEKVANRITAAEALENLKAVDEIHQFLRTNVQEALVLEVGLLKLRL